MTTASPYSANIPGHPTEPISKEELRSLLKEVESQLYHSHAYHLVIDKAQKLFDISNEQLTNFNKLIQAVSREAIALTFERFVTKQSATSTDTSIDKTKNDPSPKPKAQQKSDTVKPENKPVPQKTFKKWPWQNQKLSKSQLVAKKAEEERLEALRQIGAQLKKARESQGLTLDKLTMYTYISSNQMAALENGEIEKLPEDVFIRGFIRIMGNALGLNGANLASCFPISNECKSILPSWYINKKPSQSLNIELSSAHLYLGYTALVAGAVGGLSMIHDHVNNHKNSQLIAPTLSSSCGPGEKATNVNHQSPIQHGKIGSCFGPQISPPEAL
ncbi:helix-turn-helix domain-containing protein [Cylindrospermopsis curvispora]|uniref:Helix-turn-helix domain-containing protein n=1 Tax=Cylindrospermopsis curvispora GIHE-G1 TaxID=2666332 RepID=A0A7H0EYR3_9CYAN|nr:helix-turn-helix domain-containing protein [Cylindrospermopsis curvispora]QNP28929.1 helix-turn-helix domain-containing protein [Cylindrospermopsis curvispora GIHE-G1]